jgi:hypothetical protein
MPGGSFNLSAFDCVNGSKLATIARSVCSVCYARKGRYVFPNVRAAMARRLDALTRALSCADYRARYLDAWDTVLAFLRDKGKPDFRFFDSGDIQSSAHLNLIFETARRNPDSNFWIPTKEYGIVAQYDGPVPANVTLRVSAAMIDGQPPKLDYPMSIVTGPDYNGPGLVCPAIAEHTGECGDCRACWNPAVPLILYPEH